MKCFHDIVNLTSPFLLLSDLASFIIHWKCFIINHLTKLLYCSSQADRKSIYRSLVWWHLYNFSPKLKISSKRLLLFMWQAMAKLKICISESYRKCIKNLIKHPRSGFLWKCWNICAKCFIIEYCLNTPRDDPYVLHASKELSVLITHKNNGNFRRQIILTKTTWCLNVIL